MKAKGITEMTKEKHKFDGYAVRLQKGGYAFRKYVPFGARSSDLPLDQRKASAHASAVSQREELVEQVTNPKNWRSGALTKAAVNTILANGFKVEEPVAAE